MVISGLSWFAFLCRLFTLQLSQAATEWFAFCTPELHDLYIKQLARTTTENYCSFRTIVYIYN